MEFYLKVVHIALDRAQATSVVARERAADTDSPYSVRNRTFRHMLLFFLGKLIDTQETVV